MSQRGKYYKKLQSIPNDVRFDKLITFLKAIGFEITSGGKGSHFIAKYRDFTLAIPYGKNVKEKYIKELVNAIDLYNIEIE